MVDLGTALVILASCVESMVQLTVITSSGAVLTKLGIFTEDTNATIATSCSKFFFPIMIFVSLGQSLTLSKLLDEWPLFFNPFVIILLGSVVGMLQNYLFPPPKHLRYCMVGMMCLNNTGNVPLLILDGTCKSYGPLGSESACRDSQGYIMLQVFNFNLLTWTYGMYLFQQDQWCRSTVLLEKDQDVEEVGQQANLAPNWFKALLTNLVGPVPIGSYLGLIVGILPGTNWLMFDSDAPLRSLADALNQIGMIGIVLSQMILGSNLVLMYGRPARISTLFIITSLISRLVVIPMLGLAIMKLYLFIGIGGNRVEQYILYLGFSAPSAVSVLILAQLTNVGINELTKILFLQYVLAIVTLTLSSYLFFLLF